MGREAFFHRRPCCVFALGLMLGILLAARLSGLIWLAAISLLLSAVAFRRGGRMLVLFLIAFALGCTRMDSTAPPAFAEGRYTLSGSVESVELTEDGTKLLLRTASLSGTPLPGRARLTLTGEEPPVLPVPGQSVSVKADVKTVSPFAYYNRYLRLSADARASAYEASFGVPAVTWLGLLNGVRTAAAKRIKLLFPDSGGLARAMLLGDKQALSEDVSSSLYGAGVGHLIAVSGLHVGILAVALGRILPVRRAGLRFILLACFLAFYSLLTALSPSVLRASVMLLCLEGAFLVDRRRDLPSALGFAAILILLCRPAALLTAGFLLSFLAIYGLVTVYGPIKRFLSPLSERGSKVLAASTAVSAATFPFSAQFFGGCSPVSVAVNCALLPLAPCFLVPAAAAVALSFVFLPAARLVALPARLALLIISESARLFSVEALVLPKPGVAALAVYLLSLAAASNLLLRPVKIRAVSSLALLSLSLLCWLMQSII